MKNLVTQGDYRSNEQIETLSKENLSALKDRIEEYKQLIDNGDDKLSTRLEYYSMKILAEGSMNGLTDKEQNDLLIMSDYLKDIKLKETSTTTSTNNPMYFLQLPLSGKGYENSASQSNPEDHKYGDWGLMMTLVNATEKWDKEGNYPMRINDLGLFGDTASQLHTPENPSPHSGVDVNLKNTNGDALRDYHDAGYDREALKSAIELLINSAPNGYEVNKVLYNDREILRYFENNNYTNLDGYSIVGRSDASHDRHFHLQVKLIK